MAPAQNRCDAVTKDEKTILVRNVAVGGRRGLDVRAGPELILEVGRSLCRRSGEEVVDGEGGAVIPGLHDHHVHLRAVVARRESVDVSAAENPADFDRIVSAAAAGASPQTWLRITGWNEHAAGQLDRYRLEVLTGRIPVRVQHRSGAMWVLNSSALRQVDVGSCDLPGVERDDDGTPTGRLLRMDGWLRDRLAALTAGRSAGTSSVATGLAAFATVAARSGVTGFTDATPGRDQADVAEFAELAEAGVVPQRLVLMAAPGLREPDSVRVTLGPQKVVLDDATLPSASELAATITSAHRAGSWIAVHCVTAEQLLVSTAALEQAGRAGDRIEHAGIVPPGCAETLARLGIAVVTNPGFIVDRGDDYLRKVPAAERDWLYPCASLIKAGVALAAGTDAPFGPADPWQCIAAATTRRTATGSILGPAERVSARRALRLFLTEPSDARHIRTVAPGQPSDLCLLRQSLRMALARPSATAVLATIISGCITVQP
jgi:predicted amidohydrolase YtcJ